jgi:transposase InsO family protein
MDQGRLSAAMSRMVALGKASQRGEIVGQENFPSVHAFLRRLESEVAPALIEYARKGQKKWYDKNGINIERDYSQVPVGRVWVGDTHTWDVFVRVGKDPVPSTVYITLMLDMASQFPMGWHIHVSAPSAENAMRALKHGVEQHGIPEECYIDNGREYKNKDFSGITHGCAIRFDEQATQSVAAILGIRMRFALPYNARAKIIERNFREIKDKFSRFWQTFKGGSVAEKPERLKATLKRGDIPTLEDFTQAANQFLSETFPQFQHKGHFGNGAGGLRRKFGADGELVHEGLPFTLTPS